MSQEHEHRTSDDYSTYADPRHVENFGGDADAHSYNPDVLDSTLIHLPNVVATEHPSVEPERGMFDTATDCYGMAYNEQIGSSFDASVFASPGNAVAGGIAVADQVTHHEAHSGSELIECFWAGCRCFFQLSSFDEHWRTHAAEAAAVNKCLWEGCLSTARSVKAHLYDSHLNLRYVCTRCLRGDFTTSRSLVRHQQGCPTHRPGPVRCANCALLWPNQLAMSQHVPFCASTWISEA